MNLIDRVRERLGLGKFVKIDPNTQQLPEQTRADTIQRTGQAVVSAVLTAIYQLSRTEKGFSYMLNKDNHIPWSVTLFGEEAESVISSIAKYAGESSINVKNVVEETGDSAWQIATHQLEGKLDFKHFGNYMSGIRNELLDYLPPQLNLGAKLHDNSLDDRTNKMEGPVSGMVHRIEKLFSEPQEHDRFKNS